MKNADEKLNLDSPLRRKQYEVLCSLGCSIEGTLGRKKITNQTLDNLNVVWRNGSGVIGTDWEFIKKRLKEKKVILITETDFGGYLKFQ